MTEQESIKSEDIFHFWDEINAVVLGKQSLEEFWDKYEEALYKQIVYDLELKIKNKIEEKEPCDF